MDEKVLIKRIVRIIDENCSPYIIGSTGWKGPA